MMVSAVFAFLHHLLAFSLVAALVVEFVLIKEPMTRVLLGKLLLADAVYGISALVLFFVGFARVYQFEKGAEYYFGSASFNGKFSLFLVVVLVSLYQTITYFRWRAQLRRGDLSAAASAQQGRIRTLIGLELAGIAAILFFAALMARGL